MLLRPLCLAAGVLILTRAAAVAEEVDVVRFDSNWEWLMILPPGAFVQLDPASVDADFLDTWTTAAYDGPAFREGVTPLQYGGLNLLNNISFPGTQMDLPSPGSRFTVYCRTSFDLAGDLKNPFLEFLIDDGFILYVDGVRWLSKNMRPGATSVFGELAAFTGNEDVLSRTATGDDGVTPLPSLSRGHHTMHLSVHNSAPVSSDLGFMLRLTGDLQLPMNPTLTVEAGAPSSNGSPRILLRAKNPTPASTFIIQQSADLSHWFQLTTLPPGLEGGNLAINLPATGGRKFFRLAQ